jgi:uncharacterized membrane protein YfhO
MAAPSFDPAINAVLHTDTPAAQIFPPAQASGVTGDSTAEIIAYTPTRVEVRVNAVNRGTLILTDAYDAGWRATVNDEPAPLYRANAMFRAVVVNAGESIVTFTYAPSWSPLGFIISGASWLLLGVFVLVMRRNTRDSSKI